MADDGAVVVQRIDPEAHWTPGAESTFGPVRVRLAEVEVQNQIFRARIEYRIEDQVFPQEVTSW